MGKLLLAAMFVFLQSAAAQAQVGVEMQKPIPRWMHAVSLGAAVADISVTAYGKHAYPYPGGFVEYNVLAKPVVNLPNPVYVPLAVGIAIGFNLLADRMNRSRRFHRFARPMLLLQSAGSCYGTASTKLRS